eukprot:c3766_g1_i1.p1 GENE.c3766_g1_i1~~c3766_g1_i1.p1  ORF type:complete len:132 (+),score=1.94 c3766_g1_i1:10-405(+)
MIKTVQKVAIIGASDKPERYAYKALKMLQQYNHEVYLVNPAFTSPSIEGLPVYKSISDVPVSHLDTITMYVNPSRANEYVDDIIKSKPDRVIFNPGAEVSGEIEAKINGNNIKTENACTLVLLRSNQFAKI